MEKHIKKFEIIEHFINKDFNIECGIYHIITEHNDLYITQTKDDYKAILHYFDRTELEKIKPNIIKEIEEVLKERK